MMSYSKILIILLILFISISYFKYIAFTLIFSSPALIWFLYQMRYSLAFIPFYIISKIQNKNFKIARSSDEIKSALQLTDKGRALEELFSCEAFLPIISLESVNHKLWERVRRNFFILKDYLPSHDKLGEIVDMEAKILVNQKILIDSKQISISTVKIFIRWLFCENNKILTNDINKDALDEESFNFINSRINNNLLNELYESSLEYRKEIAVKGKGCMYKKKRAIDIIVNIFKESKFNSLFDWDHPECYSIVMQPFIISPMINMSDIAVSIKKYKNDKHSDFSEYIENCIYKEHPFPILERYDAKTNTQIFIDFANLKDNNEFDGKFLNFGYGIRSCLGRIYAKVFLNKFFSQIYNLEIFIPEINHLYSGRDNDKFNLFECFFQMKTITKVILKEFVNN